MTRTPGSVVLACSLLTFSACLASGPTIPDDVRQNVRDRVDNDWSVGIVVGMIDAAGESYYSYGSFSKKGKRKVDENTIYEIGSITKAFTGILVADCAKRGTVRLDDPVAKHVPEGVKVPSRNGKKITLKDIATHRSGLPRLPSNFAPKDKANPYADYTVEKLYEFLGRHELERDIGSKYEYSNLAVGFLGNALSHACGTPYEQLVVDRICDPLGMADTRITLSPEQWKRTAKGYAGRKEAKNWDIPGLAGAGALRSSAKDMLRFLAGNLGLVETKISPAMQLSHQGRSPAGSSEMSVALCWHVDTRADTEIIWHNGGTGGYRTFCGFAPAKKLGVVILSNSTDSPDDVGLHALDPKYGLKERSKGTIALASKVLDRYVGYYELQPGVLFHITRNGPCLFVKLADQPAFPVYPKSETRFFYKVVDAQLTFSKDENGKVTSLTLYQNGIDQTAKRMPPDFKPPKKKEKRVEVKIDLNILKDYVGKYELAPGQIFDVKLVNGKLMVQLTGQPRSEVFAESRTEFFYKVVDAQITFVRDDQGKVTRLVLHQSGTDIPAEKIK